MSNPNSTETKSSQKQGASLPERMGSEIEDAGARIRQRADDALRASTDAAKDKFQEAAEAAKDLASGTAEKIREHAEEQRHSGADFMRRFAGNIREAARAFENDVPFAAKGISSAADYVEDVGDKIREGSFSEIVGNATGFAKRQPAAFLGLSVLAGFAAVRFLRASNGGPSSSQDNSGRRASTSHGKAEEKSWAGRTSNPQQHAGPPGTGNQDKFGFET